MLTAAIEREKAEEDIRQAREEAETASRAKSEFLSRMSHELRTPLNAILGWTQLMEAGNVASPSLAESVDHISRAGKHLLSLINEVLDISRIDAGRFALHAGADRSPRPSWPRRIERIRPLAHAARSRTASSSPASAADPPLQVLADRQRLHQVMFNLLSNAVKYNRARRTGDRDLSGRWPAHPRDRR